MYVIVGLGNPGDKYARTRHNVGFDVIDLLAEQNGISVTERKHKALIGKGRIAGQAVILVKPQTFMNLSGKSVVACMQFYHLAPSSVVVIHDELDLPVGDIRAKVGGGAGGHNGLKSIIELTGSAEFGRLRIGIGRPIHGDVVNYVLGSFPEGEQREAFEASLNIGVDALRTYLTEGSQAAMRFCNGLFRAKKKKEAKSEQ